MESVTFVIFHASSDEVQVGMAANVGDGIPGVLVSAPDPETGAASLRLFIPSPGNAIPCIEGALEGTDPGQWSLAAT